MNGTLENCRHRRFLQMTLLGSEETRYRRTGTVKHRSSFHPPKIRYLSPRSRRNSKCVSAALHFLTPQHTIQPRDGGGHFASLTATISLHKTVWNDSTEVDGEMGIHR